MCVLWVVLCSLCFVCSVLCFVMCAVRLWFVFCVQGGVLCVRCLGFVVSWLLCVV